MLNLDRPRDRDIHTIADFMELLCLVNIDREMSVATLCDHIQDNKAGHSFAKISEDESVDIMGQIEWRVAAFGAAYPFIIAASGVSLSCPVALTPAQEIYVFTLLCASLPFVPREQRQAFTDAFEHTATYSLKRVWPLTGQVLPFGKNTTEFVGAKWERFNALSEKIGGTPSALPGMFRQTDSGDGGIDLVAWHPLDMHERKNIPTALAQCACSRSDWPSKQSEISYQQLEGLLRPSLPWVEMLFCPISFRNNAGGWAYSADVASIVLVDRLRIISILREDDITIISGMLPATMAALIEPSSELV